MKATVVEIKGDYRKLKVKTEDALKLSELVWYENHGDALQSSKAYADLCRLEIRNAGIELIIQWFDAVCGDYPQMVDWKRYVDALIERGQNNQRRQNTSNKVCEVSKDGA